MRGTVTHWGEHAHYGFVTGADGREYVLREDELPSWMRVRNASPVGGANGTRLGIIVEFDAVDIGSRKLSCKNVFVLIPTSADLLRR
jgi:hypothetical protein